MKYCMLFLACLLRMGLLAQDCKLNLSGHVEDADTKELLDGAAVTIKETGRQVITDNRGDFRFDTLCAGNYTLLITHISCDAVERTIHLTRHAHIEVYMPHARRTLGAITVEAQKGMSNTGFKKELTARELDESKGLGLAETLSKLNGVTMLQTGSTISKPVIHGLHSTRILLINNGVRQEGQQWGNEHAPEIDPFIAGKITVIKGVDELRYGSDAIAGVILVEPRAIKSTPGYAAEFNSGYFTNNRKYVVSGLWEHTLKTFSYRVQGTFKKGANSATPHYRLNNTASQEANFSITTNWKTAHFNTELFYSHFATKLGIFTGSHIGNLTDLQDAIQSNKPAAIFLGENKYDIDRPYQQVTHQLLKSKSVFIKGAHKFNLLLSAQFNNRQEFDIVRSSTNTRPQLDLSIYTFSEELTWEHPRQNGFNGIVGISATQQDNGYKGRYFIPNYFSSSAGAFFIEKWSKHHWELQAGVRLDHKNISTNRLKFNGDTINHDFNYSTFASSFNAIYKASDHWRFNINLGLASRAPYINELLSDGIHHGTATYEKGSTTLQPEQSVTVASGVTYTAGTFSVDVLLYANSIKDFIYQQPVVDSPVLTIAGAFPLIEYRQTNALLTGADLGASLSLTPNLNWHTKLSLLYARNVKAKDWLILMPANRISNTLSWQFRPESYLSAEVLNVMRQTRVPDESNGKQDYKAPPAGYYLVHLNAGYAVQMLGTTISFGITVRNLFNTAYRDYLNNWRYFTDEMGRNIGIRLKIPIH